MVLSLLTWEEEGMQFHLLKPQAASTASALEGIHKKSYICIQQRRKQCEHHQKHHHPLQASLCFVGYICALVCLFRSINTHSGAAGVCGEMHERSQTEYLQRGFELQLQHSEMNKGRHFKAFYSSIPDLQVLFDIWLTQSILASMANEHQIIINSLQSIIKAFHFFP